MATATAGREVRPLLSPTEVAELLAVSPCTVKRLAAAGELRAVRVGRQLRFPADTVEALVLADEETPA
jgi:excisionase family DNA binding protein